MRKLQLMVLSLLLAFFVFTPQVKAADTVAKLTTLPSGEIVNHDYFAANGTVQILGTVNGDVYVAGGKVIINGVVNGDVIATGGVITIGGFVAQDVRVAGGEVNIVGKISKNVTVAAGTILVSPEAKVGGNMLVFGGNTTIDGVVNGNINAFSQNLAITNAKINGDVSYWSKRDALISNDATISGNISKHESNFQKNWDVNLNRTRNSFQFGSAFISLFTTLVFGLLIIRFFPKYVGRAEEILHKETAKVFLRGFVAMIVIPAVLLLLAITIIGLPIAVIGGLLFVLYIYFSRIFAMIALGTFILSKTSTDKKPKFTSGFLVGILVYYLLSLIPFVGGLVAFFLTIAGLGAAISNDRRTWAIGRGSHIL